MNRDDILKAFDSIRVWQRGDRRAVHKPLLVLLALGRLTRGEPVMTEFASIEADLKSLLTDFGPSSASNSRHYPFWHLATDEQGGLWRLSGPESVLSRPASTTPTLSELRDYHIQGGFSPEVDAALRNDPTLVAEVAGRILDAHFPETIHADILDAVGVMSQAEVTMGLGASKPRRDPKFRERVLLAYEHRCCVCGFDLRIGLQSAGLEAAHIKWFQANGPDIEPNGLALCALHHKIFDLGAFTVLPNTYEMVFSQHITASETIKSRLLAYHGASMIMPQSRDYYPRPEFLEWHQKEVFKGPQRELEVKS